jgi:asparagine synthase (glutamine-hydrolysing)
MTSKHVKMVLTGEGSDELFGGYLYFRDSPDKENFQKELRRIFGHLHNVNC